MFNSLDDEIEKAEGRESDETRRVARYLVIVVLSTLAFSGLVLSIWFLG